MICNSARLLMRPALVNNARSIMTRPTIEMGKDRFQITMDLKDFNKDEILVKARSESVVIEGKQEVKMKNGYVCRRFVRKFKIPSSCDPSKVKSVVSDKGILTITAPIDECETDNCCPCELPVPIKYCGPGNQEDEECQPQPDHAKKSCHSSLCEKYLRSAKKKVDP